LLQLPAEPIELHAKCDDRAFGRSVLTLSREVDPANCVARSPWYSPTRLATPCRASNSSRPDDAGSPST